MNTKHTPGPWKFAHGTSDLLTHNGQDVAYVDTTIPERSKAEQAANLKLIAAAPDLLEALQRIAGLSHNGGLNIATLTTMARAAIAKATT